ncbi:SDR family oxidoreductase [Cedecea davisae]|uniref:SDR family oxidoreductase n=1 Tax=Cedecea davisae TaxID=158484 RepID=A0ABS6DCS9_9ENTR|nr:SDR family oxidoreductase [Cedecea davisae]MBU4681013.1 SDR family oxidoreductase [Cedecea davisae]MBU4685790.1 SDR family oxidoreductase [Cedecea davisae]
MLKGKRALVTGGGRDFGRALSIWLAREGVHVDLCARKLADARETCAFIAAEGGSATAWECDITHKESLSRFSKQLCDDGEAIDILLLSAAQWLDGELEDNNPAEIASTIDSGLTGSILLTQALLPALRRSREADIVSIVSACGIPQFTDSIAHPAFFAAKHGLSGFTQNLAHRLAKENIRVTGLYPPDFQVTGLDKPQIVDEKMGSRLLDARSVWETIRFVLNQPRSCHISTLYFNGPTGEALAL